MKSSPKKWIWQHENYPTFDYSPSTLASTLLDVSRNIGKLEGAIYALNEKNVNDIMIDASVNEILQSSSVKEHLIISLLYGLGLRISELSSIRVSDISAQWVQVVGKGNKKRQVPLLKSLFEEIENYKRVASPKEFLFEKKGLKMSTNQIRYMFSKLFKKCGIKATPHQLRHSFATHLLQNGARISDVSELLGHSSMVSTQIYTKLSSNKKLNEYSKAHPLCQTK